MDWHDIDRIAEQLDDEWAGEWSNLPNEQISEEPELLDVPAPVPQDGFDDEVTPDDVRAAVTDEMPELVTIEADLLLDLLKYAKQRGCYECCDECGEEKPVEEGAEKDAEDAEEGAENDAEGTEDAEGGEEGEEGARDEAGEISYDDCEAIVDKVVELARGGVVTSDLLDEIITGQEADETEEGEQEEEPDQEDLEEPEEAGEEGEEEPEETDEEATEEGEEAGEEAIEECEEEPEEPVEEAEGEEAKE